MIITTNIETFYRKNNTDLIRFLHFKGIHNKEVQADIIQSFYLRLAEYSVLTKFDATLGTFEAYVMRILANTIADYFSEEPPVGILSDWDGGTEPHPVLERIQDFRTWIIKHGGRQADNLIDCLKDRINGYELDEGKRNTYYRYLKEFMDA